MNLEKFNPKKAKDLIHGKKYNVETVKGEIITMEFNISIDDNSTSYYFVSECGLYDITHITRIAPYIEFSYVSVGDGFALTKNGSKVFAENVYGVITDQQFAEHYSRNMNRNANTYTPDTIHVHDIVKCDGNMYGKYGRKAIVTQVRKPLDLEDHGTIEVYFLNEQYFEHFSYTGWNEYMEVIEEY